MKDLSKIKFTWWDRAKLNFTSRRQILKHWIRTSCGRVRGRIKIEQISKKYLREQIRELEKKGHKAEEMVIIIPTVEAYREILSLIHIMPSETIYLFDGIPLCLNEFYKDILVVANEGQKFRGLRTMRH